MSDRDLDELAARGRAAQARERRARDEASARAVRDAELFAQISTTPFGVARTFVGGLIVGAVAAVVGAVTLVYPAVADNPSPTPGAIAQILAAIALPIVAIVIARRMAVVAGRTTYPRAIEWASSLSFPMFGLARVLAADPERTLVVTIELEPPVDLARIADAVVGLGRKHLRATIVGDRVRVTQGHLGPEAAWGATAPDTNYPVLQALRWLVPNLLEPVHATSRIRGVHLELSSET